MASASVLCIGLLSLDDIDYVEWVFHGIYISVVRHAHVPL